MKETRLIVLVTNADSLCGFSTCERLIRELSGLSLPSTAAKPTFPWFPEFSLGTNSNVTVASPFNPAGTYPAVDALTLIVACRRKSKAEETRSKLLQDFEKQLSVRDGRSSRNARTGSLTQHPYSFTATFARRLMVDAVEFDTTLNCSKNVSALNEYVNDRHSYLSHILFVNARGTNDINTCTSTYYALSPLLQACPISPSRVLWIDDSNDTSSLQLNTAVAEYLDVQAGNRDLGATQTRSHVGIESHDNTNRGGGDLKRRSPAPKKTLTRIRHLVVHAHIEDKLTTAGIPPVPMPAPAKSSGFLGTLFSSTKSRDTASSAVRLALMPFLLLPSPPPGDPAMAARRVSAESILTADSMTACSPVTMSSSPGLHLGSLLESETTERPAWIVGAH